MYRQVEKLLNSNISPTCAQKNFKIPDSGDRHLEKSKYRYISAMVGPNATKFGTVTQFYPLDRSVSKIGPSSCTF